MRSFLQSDSTYRAEKGGKGVGRFAWLKAFIFYNSKKQIGEEYENEKIYNPDAGNSFGNCSFDRL